MKTISGNINVEGLQKVSLVGTAAPKETGCFSEHLAVRTANKKNMIITIIIMLWHFSIRTGHEIDARRLDLLIIDKIENNCQIIE